VPAESQLCGNERQYPTIPPFSPKFPYFPHHMREYYCNLVYLKVWDREQGCGFDEDKYNLTLSPSTSMYAGQTNDFHARERSRQDDGRTPFLLDLEVDPLFLLPEMAKSCSFYTLIQILVALPSYDILELTKAGWKESPNP
jgi:hypothetical protein